MKEQMLLASCALNNLCSHFTKCNLVFPTYNLVTLEFIKGGSKRRLQRQRSPDFLFIAWLKTPQTLDLTPYLTITQLHTFYCQTLQAQPTSNSITVYMHSARPTCDHPDNIVLVIFSGFCKQSHRKQYSIVFVILRMRCVIEMMKCYFKKANNIA